MEWLDYIKDNFGMKSDGKPASPSEINLVPLYIRGSIKLYTGHVETKPVLWGEYRSGSEFTPDQLEIQSSRLRKTFGRPFIYIFHDLDSWNRKRLIKKKISFIQPYKQLYIPELLIELSDVINKHNNLEKTPDSLSYPGQCLLLYHLQKEKLDGRTLQSISGELGYSKMTISRIVKELKSLSLADVSEGKEKYILFKFEKKTLWEKALPFFKTPVKEILYSDRIQSPGKFLESGEHALANYGMLSTPKMPAYAIGKNAFRILSKQNNSPVYDKLHGNYKIEVWHYDPMILVSKNQKIADRLSVYLSLKDDEDERLQFALKQMINDIKW
jgi:hypothetical protein